jgi:hypothetical protein
MTEFQERQALDKYTTDNVTRRKEGATAEEWNL